MLPHTHTHTHTLGGHGRRILGYSPSLRPALVGNLVPSANTHASQGGLKWRQGMLQRVPGGALGHRLSHVRTVRPRLRLPATATARRTLLPGQKEVEPQHHNGVPIPLARKSPRPPEPSLPAHLPCLSPAHQEPSARCSLSPSTEGGSSREAGMPALAPSPSQPQREVRALLGWGPAGAAPGLAVLYGFLFLCDSTAHSYRDWSRAHGGGSQRRARGHTEQRGPRRPGQRAPSLPGQAAWPGLGSPPQVLPSPASWNREGLWIPALRPHTHCRPSTRTRTTSPEEQDLKDCWGRGWLAGKKGLAQ